MSNSRIDKVYIKARAKINLNLHIFKKREDNYHNLESVFQKINLYDELYVSKNETGELILNSNIKELENNNNIIYKAYNKLKEKYKQINGITVELVKNIPMQAGLAGGSTDGASFILAVNKLYNLKMAKKDFLEIGSALGADVVPCYYNRAVKANGIGDIINEIDTTFKYYILIIKPKMSFSTKEMYNMLDSTPNLLSDEQELQNTRNIVTALKTNNMQLLSNNLYNTFEKVVPDEIHKLKQTILKNGADAALMSGSGSSVYGIFENKANAKQAYNNLKGKYEVYICTSYNTGKKIW